MTLLLKSSSFWMLLRSGLFCRGQRDSKNHRKSSQESTRSYRIMPKTCQPRSASHGRKNGQNVCSVRDCTTYSQTMEKNEGLCATCISSCYELNGTESCRGVGRVIMGYHWGFLCRRCTLRFEGSSQNFSLPRAPCCGITTYQLWNIETAGNGAGRTNWVNLMMDQERVIVY